MSIKYPPLLLRYLKQYQDNPKSRIFAPLAEAYRKIGLVDEAIEICREGLEFHPHFSGGKVALARALYDKKRYAQVRGVLKSIVEETPDNLLAQRLIADSSVATGHLKDALTSYKMILYFNPGDKEIADLVQELETNSFQHGSSLIAASSKNPEKVRKLIKLQALLSRIQSTPHI